ncbi:MAG: T9SS type A sorting domain-containing protein [Chitinophagaceae bacterium]
MKTRILPRLLFTLFTICFYQLSQAQQWVISDKDQTRPDPNRDYGMASYGAMIAEPFNGYNEIRFSATGDAEASRFIVEYSVDGVVYQTAGEIIPNLTTGLYAIKHYTQNTEPLLYRVGIQNIAGRMSYSRTFMVDGIPVAPVRLIPNSGNQNVLNVISNWPVMRVNLYSLDGNQVMARDVNGQRDFIPVAIPSLSKGMYMVSFIGEGWQYTTRFLVP